MQVVDVVRAAPGLGDDVVNLEQLEEEVSLGPVAQPFLLAEEGVLVLAVVDGGVISVRLGKPVRSPVQMVLSAKLGCGTAVSSRSMLQSNQNAARCGTDGVGCEGCLWSLSSPRP